MIDLAADAGRHVAEVLGDHLHRVRIVAGRRGRLADQHDLVGGFDRALGRGLDAAGDFLRWRRPAR